MSHTHAQTLTITLMYAYFIFLALVSFCLLFVNTIKQDKLNCKKTKKPKSHSFVSHPFPLHSGLRSSTKACRLSIYTLYVSRKTRNRKTETPEHEREHKPRTVKTCVAHTYRGFTHFDFLPIEEKKKTKLKLLQEMCQPTFCQHLLINRSFVSALFPPPIHSIPCNTALSRMIEGHGKIATGSARNKVNDP